MIRPFSFVLAALVCLSKIKSEHIRGAIRRGLGGKGCALPSSRCAIGARPYPRPSACASHYSSERKISECGADAPRPGHDVVQTLPPDRSDQPFGKAVLPG